MLGSGRTARSTGREPTLILMEKSMSENSRTANVGVALFTKNTGMWKAPIQMVFGKQGRVLICNHSNQFKAWFSMSFG